MTRIAAIRADRVRVPFRRPFATGAGMWLAREAWIVRLIDGDGRAGAGEAVLDPADGAVAASVLDALVRELAGSDPSGGLPGADELEAHGSPGRALRAALDAARHDLGADGGAGSPHGPLAGVGVNATLASIGPAASAEAARQAVSAGFGTLKLKAGAERETEALAERVRAVREAVGPGVRLRLDANGAWDLGTAADRLRALAPLGIEYAEQPLAGDDPAALAELRRRVGVPLAADETVTSLRAARALLAADAVDVLVVKPARVGGLVAAAEIADLAAGHGVPVVVSTLFETGVGIAAGLASAAALPGLGDGGRLGHRPAHGLATAGLLEDDLLADGLVLEGGLLRAPGGAGAGRLGVRLDEASLARYAADRAAGPAWEAWGA